MRASSGTSVAPWAPMARQLAKSSSWMCRDSSSSSRFNSSTEAPACTCRANVPFMRSMAQNRFTAVGRVAAISSHDFWNSVANCLVPLALLRFMPSASPMAAATPMAGAPRITIVLMAFATSLEVLHVT